MRHIQEKTIGMILHCHSLEMGGHGCDRLRIVYQHRDLVLLDLLLEGDY
jgi:hypothetical protein